MYAVNTHYIVALRKLLHCITVVINGGIEAWNTIAGSDEFNTFGSFFPFDTFYGALGLVVYSVG